MMKASSEKSSDDRLLLKGSDNSLIQGGEGKNAVSGIYITNSFGQIT